MNSLGKLAKMIYGRKPMLRRQATDDTTELVGDYVWVKADVCEVESAEADLLLLRLQDGVEDAKMVEQVLSTLLEEVAELRGSLERGVKALSMSKKTHKIKNMEVTTAGGI